MEGSGATVRQRTEDVVPEEHPKKCPHSRVAAGGWEL